MKRRHQDISGISAEKLHHSAPPKTRRCLMNARSVDNYVVQRNNSETKQEAPHKCILTAFNSKRCCPESLLDLSAKVCAAMLPYQAVEDRCIHVPDPVMQKLIYWSFPRHESDIERYSSLSCNFASKSNAEASLSSMSSYQGQRSEEGQSNGMETAVSPGLQPNKSAFDCGSAMVESDNVKELLQIGFYLSGEVENDEMFNKINSKKHYHVSIAFDRCKITSVSCDCNKNDIFFCRHVVALALFRIRSPHLVTMRSPISDTLQKMDRNQLQKLTQYLLAQHNEVLPRTQNIAELLLDSKSELNSIKGAPDPTAGAGLTDINSWVLDEEETKWRITYILEGNNTQESVAQIQVLLVKVSEMLKVQDTNGSRLLTFITKGLIHHCTTHISITITLLPNSHYWRPVWDKIGRLWLYVVLNPKQSLEKLQEIVFNLKDWNLRMQCTSDIYSDRLHTDRSRSDQSVFSFAIRAATVRWDNQNLQNILHTSSQLQIWKKVSKSNPSTDILNEDSQLLWHEPLSIAVARVEALNCHGYVREAVALACSIAQTIIYKCETDFKQYKETDSIIKDDTSHSETLIPEIESHEHPLHLIGVLFDILVNAENTKDCDMNMNSYKCLAFEVALLSLGQRTSFSSHCCDQNQGIAAENALIDRLKKLSLNDDTFSILKNVCLSLLGETTKNRQQNDSSGENQACHNFANYLFHTVLPNDRKLAFKIGNHVMKIPVSHQKNIYAAPQGHLPGWTMSQLGSHMTKCHIQEQMESNVCNLASSLINAAKGDFPLLREIFEGAQQNIRNPNHLLQLSRDAYKAAMTPVGSPDMPMLEVALQLCTQALQLTIYSASWPRPEMIGWLVVCATEVGLNAIVSIVKSWQSLFTPAEATTTVANCVISPNTAIRLNLDPIQRDELFRCVCQMTIQCTVKDPQSHALRCLTLCEKQSSAFDATYDVIMDAVSKDRMKASQLYNIARYLEQRRLRDRAFTVAFAATRCLTIGFNHETHPATSDLMWTIQLAQSIGKNELMQMISVVCCNVKCATVLSEVLQICTSGVNSCDTVNIANFGERRLRPDNPILQPIVEAAISAYTSTIHAKLSHISPRHYIEFIHFFRQAQDTFLLSVNGHARLQELKSNLKTVYKGKKKLLKLISLHFG